MLKHQTTILTGLLPLFLLGCETGDIAGGSVGPVASECSEVSVQGKVIDKRRFETAGVTLGKWALGKLEYQNTPELSFVYSQATRNNIVSECLLRVAKKNKDIDSDDPEQVAYLRSFLHFVSTGPTPDKFIEYTRANPFPRRGNNPPSIMTQSSNPDVHLDMIEIPGGDFIMGSSKDEIDALLLEFKDKYPKVQKWFFEDELPKHPKHIATYWIDKYEVSNDQFEQFLNDSIGEKVDKPSTWDSREVPAGRRSHPVSGVDKFQAKAYCKWMSKRLPTEAEWEKASRGPNGNRYPWGNESRTDKLNAAESGRHDSIDVKTNNGDISYFGVLNMAGNVMELVDDGYVAYSGNNAESKQAIDAFEKRRGWTVARGSSFDEVLVDARGAGRRYFSPTHRGKDIGFRCSSD